jgi:hypothetical protein
MVFVGLAALVDFVVEAAQPVIPMAARAEAANKARLEVNLDNAFSSKVLRENP